ncbi:hypothetical protein RF11_06791 [Thelohanellus kitauei]|uniref:Uncharacterized protein n=1 Tax=Thelohanellus kitauei TaxID=669202 RepID=A0A0C2N362_THEKT|nr:hypothetical protein RF11_06791 [Thelohanellus kitauei]
MATIKHKKKERLMYLEDEILGIRLKLGSESRYLAETIKHKYYIDENIRLVIVIPKTVMNVIIKQLFDRYSNDEKRLCVDYQNSDDVIRLIIQLTDSPNMF